MDHSCEGPGAAAPRARRILTINGGSSSIRFSLQEIAASEVLLLAGSLTRLGLEGGSFRIRDATGAALAEESLDRVDHGGALRRLLIWLRAHGDLDALDAVGHRLVHGGREHDEPRLVTPGLLETLRGLVPLAPDHLPQDIAAVESFARACPNLPQVACFDTAFHHAMPLVAQAYALPARFHERGVLRYGFHGLSCESVMHALRREAPETADGRLVIAHLGNGASMTAVLRGRSVDTTMGLTPESGLVMGTRAGDLDAGVVLHLIRHLGLDPDAVDDLINHRSGLLGVSGISSDMRDLLEREADDPHAALALELFCYRARKHLAALAATLGGLDALIFTGGIGENAPSIRRRICQDLEFLGIRLDSARNERGADVISARDGPVGVSVVRADEERMIARHTAALLGPAAGRARQARTLETPSHGRPPPS